jgi:hypothetical protein
MCIILPVSHIPCTHTIAIWQHCIEATRSGIDGVKPCWNVQQHEQAVITRKLCEECSGQRFFARRGGVAERGNGSPSTAAKTNAKAKDDDADDSGYHSDVIHEEDEGSDLDEPPISPKAMAPTQPRTKTCRPRKRSHRSLNRKPSWRPNLKRDLSLENATASISRRDSIDSLLYQPDDSIYPAEVHTEPMESQANIQDLERSPTPTTQIREMRQSTLLHPSSPPPMVTTGHAQMAKAFPFPQIVEVRRPSSIARARKKSTLLHPSSPILSPMTDTHPDPSPSFDDELALKRRPTTLMRRGSSLLHPSKTAPVAITAQHKTIISIPPQSQNPSPGSLRRMPRLQTIQSEPQSTTMAQQRRASILHSCLSDDDEDYDEVRPALHSLSFTGAFGDMEQRTDHVLEYDGDYVDGTILSGSAKAAIACRRQPWGQQDDANPVLRRTRMFA